MGHSVQAGQLAQSLCHSVVATDRKWYCGDPALEKDTYSTLGEIVIPCLLSVCFDDAMHGII